MNSSAMAGFASNVISAPGKSVRSPRKAGSHITASPIQFGARTRIREGDSLRTHVSLGLRRIGDITQQAMERILAAPDIGPQPQGPPGIVRHQQWCEFSGIFFGREHNLDIRSCNLSTQTINILAPIDVMICKRRFAAYL